MLLLIMPFFNFLAIKGIMCIVLKTATQETREIQSTKTTIVTTAYKLSPDTDLNGKQGASELSGELCHLRQGRTE